MRINVALIAAILCDLALAVNYDIHLYKNANCGGSIGQSCKNIEAGKCCSRASAKPEQAHSLWHSAKYNEVGGKAGHDQVKVYQTMGSDPCGLPAAQSTGCASVDAKLITGASVHVVVPVGSGGSSRFRRDEQLVARTAEPDSYFYENGPHRYSIAIRSPLGEAFDMLGSEEEQVKFLKRHGELSQVD